MAWPNTSLVVETTLELAADLTADPTGYAFATDITSLTYDRSRESSIVIQRGRTDEQTRTGPSSCDLQLNNRDGRFSPRNPIGPYYPDLRRNTPIRLRVNPGSGLSTRYVGFLSDLPPRWDPSESDHYVPVVANGILRRLGQGQSPLRSALYRAITSDAVAPAGYWPLEDGANTTAPASGFIGAAPMSVAQPGVTFGDPGPAGAASSATILPSQTGDIGFPSTSFLTAPVVTTSGFLSVTLWVKPGFFALPTGATIVQALGFTIFHYGGTFTDSDVYAIDDAGSPRWELFSAHTSGGDGYSLDFDPFDDEWHEVQLRLTQNGANVDAELFVDGVSDGFGPFTFAGQTLGTRHVVRIYGGFYLDAGGITVETKDVGYSHLTVRNESSTGRYVVAGGGHTGELAGVRFARLCTEESVPFDVAGTGVDTYAMGPQTPQTLLTLLRECEAASAGVIVDRRTGGLGLDLTTARENQTVDLILDYTSGHVQPPLEPTDDDQLTRNDVTVTATNTSSAQVVLEDGPLGVTAVGRYDEQHTISLDPTDPDLPLHHAGWRVNLGTVDQMRFPTITVNLRRNDDLVASWLALDVGSRIRLTNLPDHISYDDIDLIVEGYTEQISQKNWIATFNCAPAQPYQVGVLAEDDMTLLTAEDTTSTAWRIGSEPRLTVDSDDLPLALRVGGEVVSVTASAAESVGIAVGTPTHADNASVTPTLATHAAGDLLLVLAAIRNSGTGTVDLPSGWTDLVNFGNMRLIGKYATSSADSNPVITFTGGVAGATTSAVAITLPGCQLLAEASSTQLNGSAQDIAFPVFVVGGDVQGLILAWKQDDYTSVAPPSAYSNEVVEGSTTTGDDQSLYIARKGLSGDPNPVAAGSIVVTGGAAAISRVIQVALRRGVNNLTVTRSVNGVVTSHAQLADVQVDQPMNLAL